ncbi:hypothetical protein JSR06_00100 [Candidatus Vidania fulgoroideae]|uniref:Uncharacterized protein n=1 Tax=Candidatus Vidania fulgoroideorum TaxID=881286 RepID=A0A974X7I5_9PROT|nr:hypothetical protein JSR06_00100 [Candidatus Vidania fulgoroideae]
MLGINNKVIVDYIENIKGNILFFKCRDLNILSRKNSNISILIKEKINVLKKIDNLFIVVGKVYNNFFLRKVTKLNIEEKIAINMAKRVYILCNSIGSIREVSIPVIISKFLIKEGLRNCFDKNNVFLSKAKTNTFINIKKTKYSDIRDIISKIPFIIKNGIFEVKPQYKIVLVNKEEFRRL